MLTTLFGALAVLFVLGGIGSLMNQTPDVSSQGGASPGITPSETESEGHESASPEAKPGPEQVLDEGIRAALGDINRDDVERVSQIDYSRQLRVLDVIFALNDNFTEGMIKDGAKMDIAKILEVVQKADVPVKRLHVAATFSLVDQLGNASEDVVIRATYRGTTIRQINFENFLFDNVYAIADGLYIHPAFEE